MRERADADHVADVEPIGRTSSVCRSRGRRSRSGRRREDSIPGHVAAGPARCIHPGRKCPTTAAGRVPAGPERPLAEPRIGSRPDSGPRRSARLLSPLREIPAAAGEAERPSRRWHVSPRFRRQTSCDRPGRRAAAPTRIRRRAGGAPRWPRSASTGHRNGCPSGYRRTPGSGRSPDAARSRRYRAGPCEPARTVRTAQEHAQFVGRAIIPRIDREGRLLERQRLRLCQAARCVRRCPPGRVATGRGSKSRWPLRECRRRPRKTAPSHTNSRAAMPADG